MSYRRKRISINHPDRPDEYFDVVIDDPDADYKEFLDELEKETERSFEADSLVYEALGEKEARFNNLYANPLATALWEGRNYYMEEEVDEEMEDSSFIVDPRDPFPDKVYIEFEYNWWLSGNDMIDYISKEKAFFDTYHKPFLYPLTREEKVDDEVEKRRCIYVADPLRPYYFPMRRCNYNPTGVPGTYSTNRYAVFKDKIGSYRYDARMYYRSLRQQAVKKSYNQPTTSPSVKHSHINVEAIIWVGIITLPILVVLFWLFLTWWCS